MKIYLEETRNEEVLEEIINLSSDHPVHSLTHEEALSYCEWYSTKIKFIMQIYHRSKKFPEKSS